MKKITVHSWCGSHSKNINTCGVWGVRTGVQVFMRKLHTYIHLNDVRLEILFRK